MKYQVKKNFVNPWGTKIVLELEVGDDVSERNITVEYNESDVDHDNKSVMPLIESLVADGLIVPIVEPILVDYVVVKGPVKIGEETYQSKNEVKLADSDPSIEGLLNDGTIMLKSDFDALPKEPISPAPINETAEVTAPEVAGATEPRARYRGKVVVAETIRTVGAQTFKHIALETGDELDLTDREYAAEVKISYPPQA